MTRRLIAFVLIAGSIGLGIGPLSDSVYAQDAAKDIKSLEVNVATARKATEAGGPMKHVELSCYSAWGKIRKINKNYPDDKKALAAAEQASEACNFEIPVAFYGERLSPATCDRFFKEVSGFISAYKVYALHWFSGDGTPEQQAQTDLVLSRFQAELSETVIKACPDQAEAQGYKSP